MSHSVSVWQPWVTHHGCDPVRSPFKHTCCREHRWLMAFNCHTLGPTMEFLQAMACSPWAAPSLEHSRGATLAFPVSTLLAGTTNCNGTESHPAEHPIRKPTLQRSRYGSGPMSMGSVISYTVLFTQNWPHRVLERLSEVTAKSAAQRQ